MLTPAPLLGSVGMALAERLGECGELRSLVGDIAEIANAAWIRWSPTGDDKARRKELEQLARMSDSEVQAVIAELIPNIAAGRSESIVKMLATYLCLIPGSIRQALKRLADPRGITVPGRFPLHRGVDMLAFLPIRIPYFHVGETPLPGVDWQLVELLGVGGTGEVWKAYNPNFKCIPPVALKFCVTNDDAERLFTHEAAMLSRAMPQGHHSGLVGLKNTYLHIAPPCLEFEYIEGGDLARLIVDWNTKKCKSMALRTARVMYRLAQIVGYFHQGNPPIVHRDLKPANILVQRRKKRRFALKIADFGIGGLAANREIELTRWHTTRGQLLSSAIRGAHTPLYASPEQIRGNPPDPRDDVHALGVIWYQMLIGDLTVGAPTGLDWLAELVEQGMTEPQVKLIASCFASKADRRPNDARILSQLILQAFPEMARTHNHESNHRRSRRAQPPVQAPPIAAAESAPTYLVDPHANSQANGEPPASLLTPKLVLGNGRSTSQRLSFSTPRPPSRSGFHASPAFSNSESPLLPPLTANPNLNAQSSSNAPQSPPSPSSNPLTRWPNRLGASSMPKTEVPSHGTANSPLFYSQSNSQIKLLAKGLWKTEEDGMRYVGSVSLNTGVTQAFISRLRGLGGKSSALANQLENAILTKYLTKQLIWNVSKWCYEPGDGRELVQQLARELFGLMPPQFLNERNQPLPDTLGADREYQRWRALICGAPAS